MPDGLYEQDFVAWTQQQAAALRDALAAGANLPLDWPNLIEEIEDLGVSRRLELGSRIRTIIEHLLKLQHSPAADPRRGWRNTIRRSRLEFEDLLKSSPSLRRLVPGIVADSTLGIAGAVADDLGEAGEADPAIVSVTTFTAEQILDDWFPPR